MIKLLVLLAVVAAVAATDSSDVRLLKRLLAVLEEKRSMNVFDYDGKDQLKVSFQVCVQGDKSTTPCKNRKGVLGHTLHVFDARKNQVLTKTELYMEGYGGPHGTYKLKLNDGERYTIRACEAYPGDKPQEIAEYQCNEGEIVGGTPKFGFGGSISNSVDNRNGNQNAIRT